MNFYALLGHDGTLRWQKTLGGEIHTTPIFWAGNVYAAASDGIVYAFDGFGKPLWQTSLVDADQVAKLAPQEVMSSPVMPYNGRIFVGTGSGKVFQIDASTGSKTLSATLGISGRQWLTASRDGNYVFVASSNSSGGKIYTVDSKVGGIVWQQSLGQPIGPAIEVAGGALLVLLQSGTDILDIKTGVVGITASTADLIEGAAADQFAGFRYLTSASGDVLAYLGQNQVWSYHLSSAASFAPFLDEKTGLFVDTVDGTVASIVPNIGLPSWKQKVDVDLVASPAYGMIDQGKNAIVVISKNGHVIAVDTNTGATFWTQANVVSGDIDVAALVH